MRTWLSALLLLVTFAGTAGELDIQKDNLFPRVQFSTNMGNVIVELDRTRAPLTVDNFLGYVAKGHYDNTQFHRVIKDFVVQGGGYDLKFNERPTDKPIVNESGNGLSNRTGTIAMARTDDPHSATSQFYFNVADNDRLDPNPRRWGYAVFGEVVEGLEVLMQIAQLPTEVRGEFADVPAAPIILKEAKLLPEG
ncbi:peptidylprolyl isomerase [Gallaecimonas sp. GXIMD4217]|uniref:peptidylprolyl isomerase n=1 Tax=Gallaecimonas sp. GXIMD4217 TaxID=3131927 RepID=UPI00311B3429